MDKDNFSESSSDPESESGEEDEDEEEADEEEDDEMQVDNRAKSKTNPKFAKKINNDKLSTAVQESVKGMEESDKKPKVEIKVENKESIIVPSNVVKKRAPGRSSILTGRGVTTHMLIVEQILEAGEKNLTIDYLGHKFIGDLLADGTIKCHNVDKIFSSPSSWAMNCKKQINPDKKSGCGWASVRYKGRKLDEFKSAWFRKQKMAQAVESSSQDQFEIKHKPNHLIKSPSSSNNSFSHTLRGVKKENSSNAAMNSPVILKSSPSVFHAPHQKSLRKRSNRTKVSVKHSTLQPHSEPSTLVECSQFQSTGRIQPFSITISTSASLLIDFHCHLTTSEVTGYLVGKWDIGRQHVRVLQACPCKYPQNATPDEIERVEIECTYYWAKLFDRRKKNQIQEYIESKDLILLGWYHSHPYCQPDPTIRDIESQLEYQKLLKDGHYEPCVGIIVSPYDSYKKESQFNAFWVRAPIDNEPFGLPLSVRFTTFQDQTLKQDLVNDMVSLVNVYRHFNDVIKFNEMWMNDISYLSKLKHSIIRKCPQDQSDGRLLDFIHKMLMACCS